MDREPLLALAERVEQAAEGSRTLDEVISCAIFPELRAVNDGETIWIMHGQRVRILDYSGSLDAALSLKPAGWVLTVLGEGYHGGDQMVIEGGICELTDCERTVRAQAATPALALTAAALRARAAMEE